jgi:hypothetical protein
MEGGIKLGEGVLWLLVYNKMNVMGNKKNKLGY